jgi:F0F1-type ATP synthase assembly protein I
VLTFGWVLPASIAAGAGLGWVLDKVFGLFPTLTFAVAFVGFAAGLRQILKEAEALSRDGKRPGDGPS